MVQDIVKSEKSSLGWYTRECKQLHIKANRNRENDETLEWFNSRGHNIYSIIIFKFFLFIIFAILVYTLFLFPRKYSNMLFVFIYTM